MSSDFSIYHMTYAALMHDIGKLIQRSGATDLNDQRYQSKCRENERGRYLTYKHVMWTTEFLDRFSLPIKDWDSISEIAGCHHNKKALIQTNYECYLDYLMQADHIASSWDRDEPEEDQPSSYRYRSKPLYSIFDTISLTKNTDLTSRENYYLPQARTFQSTMNLQHDKPLQDRKNDYQKLNNDFIVEFTNLHKNFCEMYKQHSSDFTDKFFPLFIESVDSILEKYLWFVPANTTEARPISSLYHHVRNTACIASTLYAAKEIYATNEQHSIDDKRFLLIGCDLNGIQNYLYDLNPENSRKSAKLLRARSFHIRIILDIIGIWIIDELRLTHVNIITSSGGKLIILAPNNPEVISKMKAIKHNIEREILTKFLGLLSININWDTQIGLKDLDEQHFMSTLEQCIENMESEKFNRFKSCLQDKDHWHTNVFKINDVEIHNNSICPYCKRRIVDKQIDGEKVCKECFAEINLGKTLVKKNVYRIYQSGAQEETGLLSIGNYVLDFVENDKLMPLIPDSHYFNIRPEESRPIIIPSKPTASVVPGNDNGSVKDFSEIAECAQGVKANAILKGDVDNLSRIFQEGLTRKDNQGNNVCSITEYTTLSSMIDYFFSVHVSHLIQSQYQDSIYTVYSGGDDFCLIGAWDKVIDLSQKIKDDFKDFTGKNPDLHFSAAICLLHPKAPIRFAILDTEEQLRKAKNLDEGKNMLYLFETIVEWNELANLFDFAKKVETWLQKDTGVTTQFLYRLLYYHEMYLESKKPKYAIHNHLYDALLHYDIKRNIVYKKSKDALSDEEIDQLRSISVIDDKPILDYIRIPVCYILYKNKKHGGNNV